MRDSEANRVIPPAESAASFDAWRDWWFGYLQEPNPEKPDECRSAQLDFLLPSYAPFDCANDVLAMLSRLFVTSEELLSRYRREAVAQGLWDVACPSVPLSYAAALWDRDADDEVAIETIRVMPRLFSDLFAKHCAPKLSANGSETDDPLNCICYMWFDVIGLDLIEHRKIPASRLRAILQTLEVVLRIQHPACQESALHGLGHVAYHDKTLVRSIIERFLKNKPVSSKLRTYAECAAEGCVQ